MSAFARAVRSGRGEALRFLPALPADEAAWSALLDEAATAAPTVPAELAERLAARQRELGAGPAAEANARLLADPGGPALAVVTGQQPGLLGGSLLTFHKAAGALSLARRLDGLGGRRVVPIFWLASEDHDFDEVNRALVVDRTGQARGLKLDLGADGRSVMDLDVPTSASDVVLARLAEALPDTERGRQALDLAGRRPGEDFATWCVRVLVSVFGDSGLVIVEPPQLAPWMGAPLAWLLDNAETIRDAVQETGAALDEAGLPAPLWPQEPGATALFYRAEPGGRRLRVSLGEDGGVLLRGEPAPFGRAELRELLAREPLRGSGNVIGRVFVQNQLLPVLAYVAGPTEIAYHAQVRVAHEALGRFFPLAVPRPVGSWVDGKSERALRAFGIGVGDALAGRAAPPADGDGEVEAALAAVEAWLRMPPEEVRDLRARGGRGGAALDRALERLAAAWEKADRGVRAGFEADAGTGRARWERLMADLRPRGRPQARVLSPLSLVARHGLEAVRAGLLAMDPLPLAHHLLHLGEESP